ncbi:MAG: gamma carbonic anhydrase family protein [Alphaproteobacteria bacterium]|nr:gamma carbonic anhydrase family protein [Alphaproteobacteria bacterium]
MSGLIVPFNGFVPKVHPTAFVAPNASLIGDVEIGENCGIWFTTVLRGDGPGIRIGDHSNIQDGTVIHVSSKFQGTVVGAYVTVGHMALLHACTIEDRAFVGMHATVLDGAVVESGAMVAAGALVPPRKVVRKGELWAGNPAQKLRDLGPKDLDMMKWSTLHYMELAKAYTGRPWTADVRAAAAE